MAHFTCHTRLLNVCFSFVTLFQAIDTNCLWYQLPQTIHKLVLMGEFQNLSTVTITLGYNCLPQFTPDSVVLYIEYGASAAAPLIDSVFAGRLVSIVTCHQCHQVSNQVSSNLRLPSVFQQILPLKWDQKVQSGSFCRFAVHREVQVTLWDQIWERKEKVLAVMS